MDEIYGIDRTVPLWCMEAVLKREILDLLGYEISKVEDESYVLADGRYCTGQYVPSYDREDSAGRPGEFKAVTSNFLKNKGDPLGRIYSGRDGKFWGGRSQFCERSALFSPSDIQSIMKKQSQNA